MFLTVVNKCKQIKTPDKAKIFITALYCWGVLIYYLSSIFNFGLRLVLVYLPDSMVVNPLEYLPISNKTPKPKILTASIGDGSMPTTPFTNKLKMLIAHKWDENIGDAPLGSDTVLGGLNLKAVAQVYPDIKQVFLVAKYLFETNMDKIPDKELRNQVKFIFVDFAKKVIYRDENTHGPDAKSEKVKFGDVPF